jgi:hypothetical protein
MGFLDAILGSKKVIIEKYCRFKQKQILIIKEHILIRDYGNTPMHVYFCTDSFALLVPNIRDLCDRRNCVYCYENAEGADHALEEKLGISGLTKEELCKRVSKLSFDEYTDLIEYYRRKEGIQNYCK